jgi:hypothetical protein
MAGALALDLVSISMGGFWPQLVMKEAGTYMPSCEFDYFTKKTMEACDMLDSFRDSVVMNPEDCKFEPKRLIGDEVVYGGQKTTFTASMATLVQEGPRSPLGAKIWHGLTPGTNYATLENISIGSDGVRSPLSIVIALLDTILLPPTVNLFSLTLTDYLALWAQAAVEWGWNMSTESTDLTALRDSGAKLLSWYGITDDIVPYESIVKYLKRVQREMGGPSEVDKFHRLFLAPEVGHCALGKDPMPADPLAALFEWVENGVPPAVLDAAIVDDADKDVTRRLCKWPAKPKYKGVRGSRDKSSWDCVDGMKISHDVRNELNRALADRNITQLHFDRFLASFRKPTN